MANYSRIFSTALVTCSMLFSVEVFAQAKAGKKGKAKGKPAAAATEEAGATTDAAATTGSGDTATTKPAASHRKPYGMAGCGFGSLVIKDNTMLAQIGAAFLNATGYQTFAISTGTSNCKLSKNDLALREQSVFMEVNLASLSKDAAQGQGEHLSAFAEILGCSQGESSTFSDVTRSNYSEIFKSSDANEVLSNYRSVIKSNEVLAKSCVRA
jgi:hypothetical protein